VQHLAPPRVSSTATSSSEASETRPRPGSRSARRAADDERPGRQRTASGRSAIIGCRSSTSKTRSNDTSAVITSTRALASAVIGVEPGQQQGQRDHGARLDRPVTAR
jgi:hypothetical protein